MLVEGVENKTFTKWLHSYNLERQTNYSAIIQGVAHALIYGRAGFRFLSEKEGIIFVPSNRYTIVYSENEKHKGFYETQGYLVTRPDAPRSQGDTLKATDQNFIVDLDLEYGYNDTFVYLTPDKFYNLYFYGDQLHTDTPLNHDLDRIELFLNLVMSISGTLNVANNEVIVSKLKEHILSMNNIQAGEIVTQSTSNKKERFKSITGELQGFVNRLSNLTKRKALIVPNSLEDFQILGGGITVSEFLKMYEYIETFISKLYGLSNNVINLEKMPRDASSNPIFEQMMKTSVYPKREIVEKFLNRFLADKLNIYPKHIQFERETYEAGSKITNAQSLANVVSTLANAEIKLDEEKIKEIIYKYIE